MQTHPSTTTSSSLLRGALSSPWLRPLNDPAALDDLLGLLRPTWSLTSIKARVVGVIRETKDTRTLVLEPNALWRGHLSGQHVTVDAEIAGRRLRRTFSISSPQGTKGLLSITVKRREGGRVSSWWNEVAKKGDVVTLGRPTGNFVLPAVLPPRIVMVSAGSGITPVMSMLRELVAGGLPSEVVFVHCARTRDEVIFGAELEELARRHDNFDLRLHLSDANGRLAPGDLATLAEGPDSAVFVCGPDEFAEMARDAWRRAGRESEVRTESFGKPLRIASGGSDVVVHAARSGKTFVARAGESLLVAAEAAGLSPAHGCRMGVCHTCKCLKTSGSVEDLRDGRISEESGETIQLCISTARSAVTLDL